MRSSEIFKTINWLDEMGIENYTINRDLTVDVDGEVNLDNKGLTEIPIQFGVVKGYFYCSRNQLTSLKGAPEIVGESFDCSRNQLTSLKGAPREIGGSFDCSRNQLTSLQGAPREVGRLFWCRNNKREFSKKEVKAICKVGGGIYV